MTYSVLFNIYTRECWGYKHERDVVLAWHMVGKENHQKFLQKPQASLSRVTFTWTLEGKENLRCLKQENSPLKSSIILRAYLLTNSDYEPGSQRLDPQAQVSALHFVTVWPWHIASLYFAYMFSSVNWGWQNSTYFIGLLWLNDRCTPETNIK